MVLLRTTRMVYDQGACAGENRSPHLSWEQVPEGTKSFAITLFDPSAGSEGWWHWLLFDLPTTIVELPSGAGDPDARLLPKGAIQSVNDFGEQGYSGPCPPKEDAPHRYLITVHALRIGQLGLPADTKPVEVYAAIKAAQIDSAQLVFYYGR
jgi:Raf kinase inhibitor-like YbhB/YbcL family protein